MLWLNQETKKEKALIKINQHEGRVLYALLQAMIKSIFKKSDFVSVASEATLKA